MFSIDFSRLMAYNITMNIDTNTNFEGRLAMHHHVRGFPHARFSM